MLTHEILEGFAYDLYNALLKVKDAETERAIGELRLVAKDVITRGVIESNKFEGFHNFATFSLYNIEKVSGKELAKSFILKVKNKIKNGQLHPDLLEMEATNLLVDAMKDKYQDIIDINIENKNLRNVIFAHLQQTNWVEIGRKIVEEILAEKS